MAIKKLTIYLNGVERALYGDVEKDSLADVLRRYGLTGAKIGCGCGQCGTCTVIVDGKATRACVTRFKNVKEFAAVETIEGIGLANNLHPLQRAWIKYGGVQCGFCTPGFIMSAKALLDENPNVTRQDVRDHFTKNNNLCRCTGYKQLVDAVMAAAEVMSGKKPLSSLDPDLPEGESIYHSHYPRPAALGKVMGVADYGNDIADKMPADTLKLALKLPDWQHANIISVDTSEAEKMPGVVRIFTEQDVKGTNDMGPALGPNMCRSTINFDHWYVLNGTKVTRSGDVIAIVAATTEEQARAAVKAIKVEYDKLPIYENALESVVPGAIRINPESDNMFGVQPVLKGEDTEPIFEQAEDDPKMHIVKGSFRASRQPHLALEPDTAQAFYDEEGVLTVIYKTQSIDGPLKGIPKAIGVEKVRVIEPPTGASFGAAMRYDAGAYAAIAAEALQVPVSLTMTWQEKQIITGKRGQHFGNYKAVVTDDGDILACEFDTGLEGGGYVGSVLNNLKKGGRFVLANYKCENMKGIQRGILSNNAYVIAYRGAGSPEVYTGSEQLMDMMAHEIGMDPFEFRFKNIVREGDTTPNGAPYKFYPLEDMMNKFRPTWEAAKKWKAEKAEDGWIRGIGVSIGGYHVSSPVDNSEVALELMEDGKITMYNSWQDQGQGGDIGSLVLTKEALLPLGIRTEDIRLVMNDTRMCPITGPSAASRSHYMAGRAIQNAAEQLMNAMRKEDGTYRTYEEMKADGIETWYKGVYNTASEGFTQINNDDGKGDPMPDQNFIMNIARIEVEEATGKIRIVASHNLADVGVVGNYLALDGQAYSGIFQAMGYALSEHYSDFDKKCLTPLGCGFRKCNDVPDDFTIEYHETPREKGPFGSGGASECFESVCHTCFMNAIYDAIGVRIWEMPATPDKVKDAIEKKKNGEAYIQEEYYLGRPKEEILAEIAANPLSKK